MRELIDRQVAIDALMKRDKELRNINWCSNPWAEDECRGIDYALEIVNALPSAQPEIIYCKDCKWKNRHNCIRAVEVFIDDDKYCAWAERRTDD